MDADEDWSVEWIWIWIWGCREEMELHHNTNPTNRSTHPTSFNTSCPKGWHMRHTAKSISSPNQSLNSTLNTYAGYGTCATRRIPKFTDVFARFSVGRDETIRYDACAWKVEKGTCALGRGWHMRHGDGSHTPPILCSTLRLSIHTHLTSPVIILPTSHTTPHLTSLSPTSFKPISRLRFRF